MVNVASTKHNKTIIPNLFSGELTTLYIVNSFACFFFLAFAIRNFYLENYLFASTLTAYIICSAITTYQLQSNKSRQLQITTCAILLMLALFFMVLDWGISSVYWFFPVVIGLVFILPQMTSLIFNSLILVGVAWLAFDKLEFIEAFRLVCSLFLNIIITYLVAAHIAKLHHAIKQESIRDPLTGALNRRQLDIHLTQCRHRFEREHKPACILMIDIDHFKSINDTFGHYIGDQVIINLVDTIHTYYRKQDLLFRIGGEEFVLLLPNTAQSDAIIVANKINNYLKSADLLANYTVTASIGIAEINAQIDSTDAWLKLADHYMYEAKNSGRDCICYDMQQTTFSSS